MNETTLRVCAVLGGMLAAGAFIGVMSALLSAPGPGELTYGGILLDRSRSGMVLEARGCA